MSREFARAFYNSASWKQCKEGYLKSKGYLCERCLKEGRIVPAKIVHHKSHLNPSNITIPEIALGWDNLEALCMDCHNKEHFGTKPNDARYYVDDAGRPIIKR